MPTFFRVNRVEKGFRRRNIDPFVLGVGGRNDLSPEFGIEAEIQQSAVHIKQHRINVLPIHAQDRFVGMHTQCHGNVTLSHDGDIKTRVPSAPEVALWL